MCGGGGTSGAVKFPDHMETRHEDWLGTEAALQTVSELINTGHASNPLDSITYNDPATDITAIQSEYDLWNTSVDGITPDDDWGTMVTKAVAAADTEGVMTETDVTSLAEMTRDGSELAVTSAVNKALDAIDDITLEKAVQSFINARKIERGRLRTRYRAGMSNISAERSSAYAIGMALLETDFERQTSEFQAQLSTEMYRQGLQVYMTVFQSELSARLRACMQFKQNRDNLMAQGVGQILQFTQFNYELERELVTILGEVKRIGFVMDSEYVGNTADLNWKFAEWDWKVYQHATAVLGGIGGGTALPEKPSKASSTIGGVLSGAGVGAKLGSAVPGLGTAVGAGVGAIAGGLAGLL